MQTAGSGEEAPSQNMQVLMDPVPRILACDKSLVQPVWLGADSLPWLRAATAGTSSSVVLCKSCKSSYPVLQVLLPRPVPNLCPCQLTPRSQKRACLIAVHRNGILIWTPSDSSRSLGCSSLTRTAPTPEWIVIEGKEIFLFVLCKDKTQVPEKRTAQHIFTQCLVYKSPKAFVGCATQVILDRLQWMALCWHSPFCRRTNVVWVCI